MIHKNRLPENVAKALKMVNKMADRPEGKSPMGRRFVIQAKIFINFLRRDYKAVESLLKEGRRKEGKKMLKLSFYKMMRIRLLNQTLSFFQLWRFALIFVQITLTRPKETWTKSMRCFRPSLWGTSCRVQDLPTSSTGSETSWTANPGLVTSLFPLNAFLLIEHHGIVRRHVASPLSLAELLTCR